MPETDINAPPGPTEAWMAEAAEELRAMKSYVAVVATLERSEDAGLLARALSVPIALADRIRRDEMRTRREAHRVAVAEKNDELGIPNCDHLLSRPDCSECNKVPK